MYDGFHMIADIAVHFFLAMERWLAIDLETRPKFVICLYVCVSDSIKCWSRWSLAQLMADDSADEEVSIILEK